MNDPGTTSRSGPPLASPRRQVLRQALRLAPLLLPAWGVLGGPSAQARYGRDPEAGPCPAAPDLGADGRLPPPPAPPNTPNRPPLVDPSDPDAQALGYVPSAAQADRVRFPRYAPGQACGNCLHFGGNAGEASGPCATFGGRHVVPQGWCSAHSGRG